MADLPNGNNDDSPTSSLTSIPSSGSCESDHPQLNGEVELNFDGEAVHLGADQDARLDAEANGDVNPYSHPGSDHVIQLSGIEHCMPRSYIRICLAYRLPNPADLPDALEKLNDFVRKTVDAKPYLSGYVVAVDNPENRIGAVEIRFSDTDFLEYPNVGERELTHDEVPYSYDQLCDIGLPPSVIKPELVSALGESADEHRAPVFRVQANMVAGGIIVSVYLHHCISDGTGIGWLISGGVLDDDFTFRRDLNGDNLDVPSLSMRLDSFAKHQSQVRTELSYPSANQTSNRVLKTKSVLPAGLEDPVVKPPGRGCVFAIPLVKLGELRNELKARSRNDALMTLIWHAMTKARIPSLSANQAIDKSRLNIPVDIRGKVKKPLPEYYFGAAVDFASAEMSLCHLEDMSLSSMAETALVIREAINCVNDDYIRKAIALTLYPKPNVDVRDLQGSNMNRATGADMYITSWEKLKLYEGTFDMGLGRPDWVRKPWSRDPGSCIVLPVDDRKDYLEVVIQMATEDMERLLINEAFMGYVVNWVE